MGIEIISAPEDYDHPATDREWKVGDRVVTLREFSAGKVASVYETYRNRAEQIVKRKNYLIEFDDYGQAVRFGYELLAESEVTVELRNEIQDIDLDFARNSDLLRRHCNNQQADLATAYQRRREQALAKLPPPDAEPGA